jgi:hypothetical protein
MLRAFDGLRAKTLDGQAKPEVVLSPFDIAASLSEAAAGAWEVEHAVDPSGEVAIIVLPARDDPALPTFMLYQEHGLARVATIRRDIWESDQAFPSGRRAVAAIIAVTSALAVAA